MKELRFNKIFRLILFVFTSIIFYGCNNEIYVDKLIFSKNSVKFNSNKDTTIINFSISDWILSSIIPSLNDNSAFIGKVYDEKENLLYSDLVLSCIGFKDCCTITYKDRYNGFKVKRLNDNSLQIIAEENLKKEVFKYYIIVSDAFSSYEILVTQMPKQ